MSNTSDRIPPSKQTEEPKPEYSWIGKSMKRVEDPRLLTGHGKYADDVVLPNMAHAAVLRSPHAHAKIIAVDTSAAADLPGVLAVMTGEDVAAVTGALPTFAIGCSQRSGPGSPPECLPKKLSSPAVARPVWLSVAPISPNL